MMNLSLVTGLLLFTCFLALSSQEDVNPSTPADGPDEPSPEEQFKQLFQEVDTDGSGGISPAEALAFWKEKVKTMDPEELKRRLDHFKAKNLEEAVERGFKKVDKDADGQVEPDELKAYMTSSD